MSLGRMEAKTPVVRESLFSIHQNSNSEPALNATVRAQLGRRMRSVFEGVSEPLPDRISQLLAELEKRLGSER